MVSWTGSIKFQWVKYCAKTHKCQCLIIILHSQFSILNFYCCNPTWSVLVVVLPKREVEATVIELIPAVKFI